YLVDSDLPSPQELGKKVDKWVRTRVSRKAHTGDKDGKKKDGEKSQDKHGDKSKHKDPSS
ncbi:hypothetical protein NDU88_003501, partial [Pleurodeles waltl]